MTQHQSVLLRECLALFEGTSLTVFLDGTLGAGGHAEALLAAHPEIQTYIGMDQDETALTIAKERLKPWEHKMRYVHSNFTDLPKVIDKPVNGILLDLGVSSMQFDMMERGFSFREEAPLDMRMDRRNAVTAATIINTWSERELGEILRDYGEMKPWRKAARRLVESRPIYTTTELVAVLEPMLRPFKKPGLHPLTLVFQALRIAVNRELEVLEEVVPKALDCLAPGGRIAIISFHSLEDRIVKNTLRFAASDKYDTSGIGGLFLDKVPTVELLTSKPIVPTLEEIESNPRSRSAKLRGAQKR